VIWRTHFVCSAVVFALGTSTFSVFIVFIRVLLICALVSISPNLKTKSGATFPHFWAQVYPSIFERKFSNPLGFLPLSRGGKSKLQMFHLLLLRLHNRSVIYKALRLHTLPRAVCDVIINFIKIIGYIILCHSGSSLGAKDFAAKKCFFSFIKKCKLSQILPKISNFAKFCHTKVRLCLPVHTCNCC